MCEDAAAFASFAFNLVSLFILFMCFFVLEIQRLHNGR